MREDIIHKGMRRRRQRFVVHHLPREVGVSAVYAADDRDEKGGKRRGTYVADEEFLSQRFIHPFGGWISTVSGILPDIHGIVLCLCCCISAASAFRGPQI